MKRYVTLLVFSVAMLAANAFAHGDNPETTARRTSPADAAKTPFGQPGNAKRVARVVRIDMGDTMRFIPDRIEIKRGETVKFVVANGGKMLHEMVIGTPEGIREHAALMKKFPGMEHDEPSMAHVQPGKSGEIVWRFTRAGSFQFACLMPGHFEAGMVGTIVVR
jgi:uncharacterized cupredoxin-like copper-binding protein